MWSVGLLSLLAAAGTIWWYRRRTRKLLENLSTMLDQAMAGGFTEEDFDETLLSAVETKLARYLAASTVSARNLQGEKNKIKTLISDISHQTKTPLSNIMLYTQLLQEQPLTKEGKICAAALESQTQKLQALMDALVKTSRLESGILAMHPEPGELGETVKAAVSQLTPKAEQKQIKIKLEEIQGRAVFDPKWTEEALCNLLDNALKYGYPGGEVRVQVKNYPMFAAIGVTDNGPGIREEEQPKIFGRFYRGDAHSSEEGVGIGLYLTRQIAQAQGGYVKLDSKEGEGSTFSLCLPKS